LAVGINDRAAHFDGFGGKYLQALRLIPKGVPVIAVGILPVNAAQAGVDITDDIARARRDIEAACRTRPRCLYLPPPDAPVDKSGQLPEAANIGDGVHLSTAGYRLWAAQLREAIARTEYSTRPGR
jgi:lysophospholipase L1-like esterase